MTTTTTPLPETDVVYQSAPIGLCVLDRDLRYLRINDHLASINGLPPAEHIGRTLREVLPHVADQAEPIFRRVLDEGETSVNLEIDSQGRTVRLSCVPLRDQTGTVAGVNVVLEEITDQRRTEQALRASERRFHALADNMAQLAWMADATGAIFWFNRRWFEYTGMTPNEMEGGGWRKVQHPDHVDEVVARMQQSFAAGEAWEDTFPLRGRDGTYRWFLSRAVPVRDDRGRITLWFGTETDVTEERRASDDLRRADRRKDDFLALLGHELRNPLAPILPAARILQLKTAGDPQLQKACDTIVRQVWQLATLADDLLDVGRIRAGKLRLDKNRVVLSAILAQAVESCAPYMERRGHSVHVSAGSAPIHVDGDAVRLVQVVSNLLTNAAKYTEEGGRIELTAAEEDGFAIIRVRDSGIGIAPDMLDHIFEQFVQARTPMHRGDGLGLGLSLVKSVVEMHGGTVEARSGGIGQGSEFIVRLPAVTTAGPPRRGECSG